MQLHQILDKHTITLDNNVLDLCAFGCELMSQSKDPTHDLEHVESLFDELDDFLLLENDTHDIDFNVLIIAIVWHDIWKSTQVLSKNLFKFIFDQVYEGVGSGKLFWKHSRQYSIDEQVLYNAYLAIKKHHPPIFLPNIINNTIYKSYNLETLILRDLDVLDAWSMKKFNKVVRLFLKKNNTSKRRYKIAKWWYDYAMTKRGEDSFYFNSSKKKFSIRKEKIFEEVEALLKNKDQSLAYE